MFINLLYPPKKIFTKIYCSTCSSTDVPGFVLAPNMFTPYNAQATVHSYEVSVHFIHLKRSIKF